MSRRLARLRWPLGALAVVCLVAMLFDLAGWRLNASGSVPIGFYRETSGPPEVGDLAAVCLDPDSLPPRQRQRLGRGRCANGTKPLLKCLAAAAGQRVRPLVVGLEVDGAQRVVWALPRLHPPLAQPAELESGEFWLYSPSDRSWDSRYFGAVRPASLRLVEASASICSAFNRSRRPTT